MRTLKSLNNLKCCAVLFASAALLQLFVTYAMSINKHISELRVLTTVKIVVSCQ
jgi:hypothetical protein